MPAPEALIAGAAHFGNDIALILNGNNKPPVAD